MCSRFDSLSLIAQIVLIATSASELKGHPTGLWIEELASPYYEFKEAGFEVEIASPNGGAVPIDATSLGEGFFTEPAKKFMVSASCAIKLSAHSLHHSRLDSFLILLSYPICILNLNTAQHDPEGIGKLSHSLKLSSIDFATVNAVFFCGGHGTCVDFPESDAVKNAVETMYAAGKVVAAVCHGPTALTQCEKPDGTPLVKDKLVTGFKDSEEIAVNLQDVVPFMLEAKLKELGGKYESADDWNSKVCVDGTLVTGQNPQSSEACAAAVISILSS